MADDKKPAARQEIQSPEQILAAITQAPVGAVQKTGDKGARVELQGLSEKFKYEPAPATLEINGFITKVARDLYISTGDRSKADIADGLTQLLGSDTLYELVKRAANCAGIVDESHFLRQELWHALQSGTFNPKGATQPYDKKVDGDPQSAPNQLIGQWLQKTNLGSIVQIAKAYEPDPENSKQVGVSTLDCLRWGVLNHFESKLLRGF